MEKTLKIAIFFALSILCLSCATTTKFSLHHDLYLTGDKIGLYAIAAQLVVDNENSELEKLACDVNEKFLNEVFGVEQKRVELLNDKIDRKKAFSEVVGSRIDEKVIGKTGIENNCAYTIVVLYNYSGLYKKKIADSEYYTGFVYNFWLIRNKDAKVIYQFISNSNNFGETVDFWQNEEYLSNLTEMQKYKSFLVSNTFRVMSGLLLDKEFEYQMRKINGIER